MLVAIAATIKSIISDSCQHVVLSTCTALALLLATLTKDYQVVFNV